MKKVVIIIAIVLIFLAIIIVAILDNINFLCIIAGGLDRPSSLHNFFMDKIYKIAEKKNIEKKLIIYIEENRNQYLHNLYIRILGVMGEEKALPCFMEVYIKHQDEKESSALYYVVGSIGLLGEEKVVPFLEKILNREGGWWVLNPKTANSLYLLTGKQYDFIDWNGNRQMFYPSENSKRAREVILATKTRKRTFEEMIIIDKLFR